MKGTRTGIDFSEHELIITKNDNVLIHHLKKPNTIMDNVKFINIEGVLLVTGDYSRWSFCREFHRSADGRVSDYYWCEKLSIDSSQTYSDYSSEDTYERLKESLTEYIENRKEEDSDFNEQTEDDDIFNQFSNLVNQGNTEEESNDIDDADKMTEDFFADKKRSESKILKELINKNIVQQENCN